MVYRASLPRRKKASLLAFVAGAHLAVILAIANLGAAVRSAALKNGPTTLTLVGEPPKPPKPIVQPMPVKSLVRQAALPIPVASAPAPAENTGSDDCATLEQLQEAILSDPESQEAIEQVPAGSRSLSNAIVIWNAGWSEIVSAPGAPLATVGKTLVSALAGQEDRCLDRPVAGPRLITVPVGDQTRLLVVGSGLWTWRQLTVNSDALGTASAGYPVSSPAAPSGGPVASAPGDKALN